jgi:hypothetical protein
MSMALLQFIKKIMKILLALNRIIQRLAMHSVVARHFKLRVFSPVKSILNLPAIKNKVNLVVI